MLEYNPAGSFVKPFIGPGIVGKTLRPHQPLTHQPFKFWEQDKKGGNVSLII